MILHKLL